MANYNQAPTLQFNGAKEVDNNFYKIPQELADIIFKELGNSSAQLRIMMVLVGTKPGFQISDKWICDRTGLLHPSYINARKALVAKGWLTHDAAKGITVNFDAIRGNRGNTILQNEKQCSNTTLLQRGNTTLPHCSNTTLPQCSNTTLPIINNIDNKIDNKTNSLNELPQEEKYPEVSKKEMISLGARYEVIDEAKSLYRIIATNKIVRAI